MLLNGKTILVTGATRGIGKATVEKCLLEGANVIANYRADSKDIPYLEEYSDSGRLYFIKADVRSADEVMQMMKQVKKAYGRLDGIVNNAGIISRTFDWKKISMDDWKNNINTNLIGVWNVIRFGTDIMFSEGSIVNISSIYGLFPEADELTYSISKAGVNAITQALAKELSPGIRVNAVAPGNTLTSMVPDENTLNLIENKTLLKRSAQPNEIANTIAYLLSAQSSYITGSIIGVDGGYHVI